MASSADRPSRRTYRLGRRASQVDATRRRIAAAAFELHATIGAGQTTISAVADRAGVQRHTVYAHFPDLESLFRACTQHGMAVTGMPTAATWAQERDPRARLRTALTELYTWYRNNERMLVNVLGMAGDVGDVTREDERDPFEQRMLDLRAAVGAGWDEAEPLSQAQVAFLDVALAFPTWRALAARGLSDGASAELMTRTFELLLETPLPTG